MDSTFTPEAPAAAAAPATPAAAPGSGLYSAPWGAITIGLLALISIQAFEQLAVATVMPRVAQALGGPQWYAAAFGVAVAASIVGMALAGRWCDAPTTAARAGTDGRHVHDSHGGPGGAQRALALGVVAFAIGVLLAGSAPSMPVLVLGRALQGLGTGLTAVALYVVAGQAYPPALRPRLFAAFAAAWVAPVVVGPALASLIERTLGWRWVFLLAVVLTVPAALLLRQGLASQRGRGPSHATAEPTEPTGPATPMPGSGPQASPALAWAAVTAVGAAALHAGNAASGWVLLLGAIAVLLGAPRLLPRGVWVAERGLSTVIALRGLLAASFFCGEVLIPLLLIDQRGLSTFDAGLVLTVGALGWSAGSWWQGRLADGPIAASPGTTCPAQSRQLRLVRGGLLLMGAGLAVTLAALHPRVPLAVAALGWTIAGLGIGMAFPTLSVLMLELAPAQAQGRASASLQLSDSICSALALAAAGGALAAWRPTAPLAAFGAAFALAIALTLLGAALAGRVRPSQAAAGARSR